MKISVVIPVYNTEKYIKQCIESVLNQPWKDIEVICVNDGSTDRSEEIIFSLMQEHDRIVYKKQENLGVGAARNAGIDLATGDYLAFLDSDDVWVSNAIDEPFIKKLEEKRYDLVSFAFYHGNEDLTSVTEIARVDEEITDIKPRIYENYRSHSSYLYKKGLVDDNQIRTDNCKRNEDVRFLFNCLYRAKNVLYVSKKLFTYRHNRTSTTHQSFHAFTLYDDILHGYKEMMETTDLLEIREWAECTLLRTFVEYLILAPREKNALKDIRFLYEKYQIEDFVVRGVYLRECWRETLNEYRKNPKKYVFKRAIVERPKYLVKQAIKKILSNSVYRRKNKDSKNMKKEV